MGLAPLTRSRSRDGDGRLQENPAYPHALATLRARGVPAKRVVDVRPYAVAYIAPNGKVATAWVVWLEARKQVVVAAEPGLPAFPAGIIPGA